MAPILKELEAPVRPQTLPLRPFRTQNPLTQRRHVLSPSLWRFLLPSMALALSMARTSAFLFPNQRRPFSFFRTAPLSASPRPSFLASSFF